MRKKFKKIYIDKDIINYGETCNIITFNESLFNKYQLSALSKQYEKLGFLKCAIKYKDDNVDIYYYTTNLISISQYFSQGSINKTEFISIIKTICQSIKLCSNYAYFNSNNLILDEELIYIDSKDKSVHIMYVPINNFVTDEIVQDIKKVIINLVNDYLLINGDKENFVQEILNGLRDDNLTIDEIIIFLDHVISRSQNIETKIERIVKPIVEYTTIEGTKPESLTYKVSERNKNHKSEIKGIKGFFKRIFSHNNDYSNINNISCNNENIDKSYDNERFNDNCDDTIILGENQLSIAYLLQRNNDFTEKIIINKESFVIGRLKDIVDYQIKNKTVGKIHAKFIRQANKYYLVDLESKNGTYINTRRLQPNYLNEVKNGDSIVFSNEKYIFTIEE